MKSLKRILGDICSVSVLEQVENEETGRIENAETLIFEDVPCYFISKSSSSYVKNNYVPSATNNGVLIVERNIQIPMGSKITVTQNGETTDYSYAGIPTVYSCHREIPVAIFERWV